MNNRNNNMFFRALMDIWQNCFLGVKFTLYGLTIVFFIIGILALFGGSPGLGIVLMVINALLFLFFISLEKKGKSRFDQEFDEMVRRNRGES